MVDVIKNPNFFVGVLTVLILGAYVFLTASLNPAASDVKSWVDLLLGYWIKTVVTPVLQTYQAMSRSSGSRSASSSSSSSDRD